MYQVPKKYLRPLGRLKKAIEGDVYYDATMRTLYATDASVYRELPLAVVMPKTKEDIKKVIAFCYDHNTSIIPRAAGTSLAGQCVGSGIVLDVSKYMTKILEVNPDESWVRVQPGVIRDDLNHYLAPYGLFFGPNTSTANRAMIGGMVGNNSCGSYSIVYGTTRDHILELETILSNGSTVRFGTIDKANFRAKAIGSGLENQVYRQISKALSHPETQRRIRQEFPKRSIHRRNTGYAIDELLESKPFTQGSKKDFNFCELLTGSEGTLAITTEIKIHVDLLPPKEKVLICPHFESVDVALQAVVATMKHAPRACELMDKFIMDLTKTNIEQEKNRHFLDGDPEAVLIIEFGGNTEAEALAKVHALQADLEANGMAYSFPVVTGAKKIKGVWTLRKAGLGILANIPGDAKAVACIEDTAVAVEELPAYIRDFTQMMDNYGQKSVYYAHAGAGELHLRPILDLKKSKDVQLFHDITEDTAKLVKKYQGSLSGEHGDGRVRAEFIPLMIGEKNYDLLKDIKRTWDPQNIFNPGKIVDAPPMNSSLRYEPDQATKQFDTVFNFDATQGILRATEKCNGSGDCRKTHLSGGTMCPSYMATRNEKDTTRARANILRECLTRSDKENPFDHPEIKEVMDLCLSCKGCTSECPSNVDMSTLKAEFTHQYYKANGIPMRARLFANFGKLNGLGTLLPRVSNFFLGGNPLSSAAFKKTMGIAPERSIPKLYKTTLRKWFKRNQKRLDQQYTTTRKVYFFCDEFTDFTDTEIGIKGIELLYRLGYAVVMPKNVDSGRTYFSKGLLDDAQALAKQNVALFKDLVSPEMPLIGIEPSTIFGFRDEYPKLVDNQDIATAKALGKNALMIDEFLYQEVEKGHISPDQFTKNPKTIKLHGHCHQKSLSSADYSAFILGLPKNYTVEMIPSGCCGMAGSFGYEAEHYEVSMKIGELVLFPAVRNSQKETIIAAPGTSCRHQIADGTGRKALHPVEVLWEALL